MRSVDNPRRPPTDSNERFDARPIRAPELRLAGARTAHVLLLAAFLAALLAAPRALEAKPFLRQWVTIKSRHCDVHVPKAGVEFGQRTANLCDEAYALVSAYLEWKPRERLHVLVDDDIDTANGSAVVIPYNQIVVNAYPPTAFGELGYFDDWLRLLLLHEMAHIMHLDNRSGFPHVLNHIFGKTYAPNQNTPNWLAEGLGVHVESKFTGAGRVHSSLYRMYLRMAILARAFPSLARFTAGAPLKYPGGAHWYLYGGHFMNYIAERFGPRTFARMGHLYGRRIIPFAINQVIREVTGKTFEELYRDWQAVLERSVRADVKKRRARGLTSYQRISEKGEQFTLPTFSPDGGWMLYYADTGYQQSELRLRRRDEERYLRLYTTRGALLGVAWVPGPTRKLVYSETAYTNNYFVFGDLFLHDLKTGQKRRLSRGLRASDPHVSPDGRHVVFVRTEWGRTHLALMRLRDGRWRELYRNPGYGPIHSPRFSPDGRRIVFSGHFRGQRDLYVLDRRTGTLVQLTNDRAMELDPRWSADGRYLLFSSDRDGVYNLYAYRFADGVVLRITNVLGGLFQPTIDPQGDAIVFVGYHDGGFHLGRVPYRPASWQPAGPGERTTPGPGPVRVSTTRFPVGPYQAWRTLYPRSWVPRPELSVGTFEQLIGFSLEGSDAVGHHRWTLGMEYVFETKDVNASAYYAFTQYSPMMRIAPSVSLYLARNIGFQGSYISDAFQRYREQRISASLGFSVAFPRLHGTHALSLTYSFFHFKPISQPDVGRIDPGSSVPIYPDRGWLGGIGIAYAFQDLHGIKYAPGIAEGRSFAFSFSINHRGLGSRYDTYALRWSYGEYVPIPWPPGSVLALSYNGGISLGDLRFRGAYALGGFPAQDILTSILQQSSIGGLFLRGYPPSSLFGNHFHLLNVEWRIPLWNIFRGIGTLPIYFNRLTMTLFSDTAMIAFDAPDEHDLRTGLGIELRLGFDFAYAFSSALRVGYAYGFQQPGGHQVFVIVGGAY